MPRMASGALDGLLVLDLAGNVSGALGGKILADLGAQVVMIEPAAGSPVRELGLFDYLAGGKQSVVPADDAAFQSWLAAADIVITDGTSPWHAAATDGRPDRVVLIDLSPFGHSGPYAEWTSSDLVTWAMGGYLYFTGSPDREPIWLPGPHAQFHAGAHAAFASLVGVHERDRSGHGQAVEISELDATLTAHAWLVSSWAANGALLARVPPDLIKAKDGWVYVMRIVPKDELFVMIERPDLMERGFTVDIPTWNTAIPEIFEAVQEWAYDKTVAEIVELGQLLRVAVTPVVNGGDVLDDEQLAARDWWEREGETAFPGQPYKFTASPAARRGPAPAIGAQSGTTPPAAAEVTVTASGYDESAGPLQGIRILEVTTNWAGPVAGRFLADLGSDNIKIEWATRPATRALIWPGPGAGDLQRQAHHRPLYFYEMNRNKRGVCIDLAKPDGREAFLELVKTVDVVLENNSARVMPNLGLSYEDLKAVKPDIIMVSMSGYGGDGPHRDWVAYGANIETTSSLTSITGYPDGQLSRTTLFYADPVSGNYAAVAMMAALRHRNRTGEGQWVDMSLNECGVTFCAGALLDYQRTGELRQPMANRDPSVAPQGVYKCVGNDNWVALTVRSGDEWKQVAELIGRPDLAADESLQELAARQARHDELDAAISAWTAQWEQYETAQMLQDRGVPAAPVLANWQIMADPHVFQRGLYETILHPVVGAYPTVTWPWQFERTPARITRSAPLFAEHNREILAEAGLSDDTVAALYATGTTADEPVPAE